MFSHQNKIHSSDRRHSQDKVRSNATVGINDNRVETARERNLQDMMNSSPQVNQTVQFQAIANNQTQQQQTRIKEGYPGLPDNLKEGVEYLSGYSMNDVNVHYNSDKPARLNAHAYAQGSDIYLSSGQEKQLPHEAWHVVQQKQGRVKPTLQMKERVKINDDTVLEREADQMGSRASSLSNIRLGNNPAPSTTSNQTTQGVGNNRSQQLNTPVQLKKYTAEAITINSYARKMIPYAGNRTDEVISSEGKSYAGVALIDYLINKDHAGSWENRDNLAKRSTLAVDIQAANCNQYAALSYSKALKYTKADNVGLEYDAHHAYVAVYDNEDKNQPGEQTIIDPWVKITGLRKDLQDYYQGREGNQKAITKADGANWYYPDYTKNLLKLYSRAVGDETYTSTAAAGLSYAKKRKIAGEDTL